MAYSPAKRGLQFTDENGNEFWIRQVGGKPVLSTVPFLYEVMKGNVENYAGLRVIGYNSKVDESMEDLWDVGGLFVPPDVPMQLEIASSSKYDDGNVIKSGTSDNITYEASVDHGSILTLTDGEVSFTAGTPVEVGDCLLLDGEGTYAIVQTVATSVLTAITYFSASDVSTQPYRIVGDSEGGTGVKVVKLHYLDGDYVEGTELVVTNGKSAVTTAATSILRVNELHTAFTGSEKCAVGSVDIRHLNNTPVYRRIAPEFNIDQNCFWTVPTNKAVYITNIVAGVGNASGNRMVEFRLVATCDHHGHYTKDVFHTKDIVIVQDDCVQIPASLPIRCPARTDIKISVRGDKKNSKALCGGHFEGWVE
jgi:hypothetical protein